MYSLTSKEESKNGVVERGQTETAQPQKGWIQMPPLQHLAGGSLVGLILYAFSLFVMIVKPILKHICEY